MVIDNRLLDAKSEPQLIENYNRILSMLDTLSNVVADITDSQLFKVTFDTDGGTSVPSQYVVEGEKAEQPTDPTKAGYYVGGWLNGEDEYDFDTPVTSHLNLDVIWKETWYDITYNLDGGNLEDGVTNPVEYTIEFNDFTLHNPVKEGYTFLGWTGSNGDVKQTTVTVETGTYGDLTFTANWQEVVPENNGGGTE